MREKALSVPLVTLAGRRRMKAVLCGTVLDLKAVALHTTLGAGEARRLTRYTKITKFPTGYCTSLNKMYIYYLKLLNLVFRIKLCPLSPSGFSKRW